MITMLSAHEAPGSTEKRPKPPVPHTFRFHGKVCQRNWGGVSMWWPTSRSTPTGATHCVSCGLDLNINLQEV